MTGKPQGHYKIDSMMKRKEQSYYVYIVECSDGTLYTGWTVDLEQRLAAHNQGKGAKYTRCRCPVRLQYYERAASRSAACRREYEIKRMSRPEKMDLINMKS